MEGVPNNEGVNNVESLAEWRTLRDEAPARAQVLIEGIAGWNDMGPKERIEALTLVIKELTTDNKNRYIARELSIQRERIKEDERHEARAAELGVAA